MKRRIAREDDAPFFFYADRSQPFSVGSFALSHPLIPAGMMNTFL